VVIGSDSRREGWANIAKTMLEFDAS